MSGSGGRTARRIGVVLLVLLLVVVVLAFAGAMWMTRLPGRSHAGPLPALTETEAETEARVRAHVETLAGTIGERNVWHPHAMDAAALYIAETLQGLGYETHYEEFTADTLRVRNVVAELQGRTRPQEVLVLGAHYDTVRGSPGANDNASGVAALLELARLLARVPHGCSVRFVAFGNEESPFFGTPAMGSLRHVKQAREKGETIVGMISLETMGYYTDEPHSQKYPRPVGFLYPGTGNFIAFVSDVRSRGFLSQAVMSFRRYAEFPSQAGALPGIVSDIARSDHWSFWQEDLPAFMITDTAPFRYPYYHLPTDTPEKISAERLARVIAGLARVVEDLAR